VFARADVEAAMINENHGLSRLISLNISELGLIHLAMLAAKSGNKVTDAKAAAKVASIIRMFFCGGSKIKLKAKVEATKPGSELKMHNGVVQVNLQSENFIFTPLMFYSLGK
jgi:hypothetical protein